MENKGTHYLVYFSSELMAKMQKQQAAADQPPSDEDD